MSDVTGLIGMFGGMALLVLGALALLMPLIVFLMYGELRRIRKALEEMWDDTP